MLNYQHQQDSTRTTTYIFAGIYPRDVKIQQFLLTLTTINLCRDTFPINQSNLSAAILVILMMATAEILAEVAMVMAAVLLSLSKEAVLQLRQGWQ